MPSSEQSKKVSTVTCTYQSTVASDPVSKGHEQKMANGFFGAPTDEIPHHIQLCQKVYIETLSYNGRDVVSP